MITGTLTAGYMPVAAGAHMEIDSIVQASAVGITITNGSIFSDNAIAARVRNTVNITLTSSAPLTLTFNVDDLDTDSLHDPSSNSQRLTATRDGLYLITAQAIFAANATGRRALHIYLNSDNCLGTYIASTIVQAVTDASATTAISASTIYSLAAGDYVTVCGLQVSGGPLAITTDTRRSPIFSMVRLP